MPILHLNKVRIKNDSRKYIFFFYSKQSMQIISTSQCRSFAIKRNTWKIFYTKFSPIKAVKSSVN